MPVAATGYRIVGGADLNTVFKERTSAAIANTNISAIAGDLSTLFEPIGITTPIAANTGYAITGGADLKTLFMDINAVVGAIDWLGVSLFGVDEVLPYLAKVEYIFNIDGTTTKKQTGPFGIINTSAGAPWHTAAPLTVGADYNLIVDSLSGSVDTYTTNCPLLATEYNLGTARNFYADDNGPGIRSKAVTITIRKGSDSGTDVQALLELTMEAGIA